MRRFIQIAAMAAVTVTLAAPAFAQPQRGRDRQGAAQKRGKPSAGQAQERFRQLDKDNNGALSRAEWPRNQRAFDRLDTNNDGQITPAEMTRTHNRRTRGSR